MTIVTSGLDNSDFFPRKKNQELLAFHHLEGKYVCAYVGTIGKACGLEVVFDAASKLKNREVEDVHFLLVGDGASRERVLEQTRKRGLESFISLVGRRPKSQIPDYLATVDVCLVNLKNCMVLSLRQFIRFMGGIRLDFRRMVNPLIGVFNFTVVSSGGNRF